jgi:hypothetical protein
VVGEEHRPRLERAAVAEDLRLPAGNPAAFALGGEQLERIRRRNGEVETALPPAARRQLVRIDHVMLR